MAQVPADDMDESLVDDADHNWSSSERYFDQSDSEDATLVRRPKKRDKKAANDKIQSQPTKYFDQSSVDESDGDTPTRYFDQSTDGELSRTIVDVKKLRIIQEMNKCLVECPICLSEFQEPQSLPCFHSFCKECLSAYQKTCSSMFSCSCPICGKLSNFITKQSMVQSKTSAEQKFFANNLVLLLKRVNRLKQNDLTCDPCKKQKKIITANTWCKACGSFFCDACKDNIHDLIHEDHESVCIATSKGISVSAMSSPLLCEKHKEELKLICDDHRSLGCATCMTVHHRNCKNVITSAEFVDVIKGSDAFESLGVNLEHGVQTLQVIINDLIDRENVLKMSKEKEILKICAARKAIDEQLDKIQNKLVEELSGKFCEEAIVLDTQKKRCSVLSHSMASSNELRNFLLVQEDPAKFVSVFQRCQNEIPSAKALVKDVLVSHNTSILKSEISHKAMEIQFMQEFGKSFLYKEDRDLPQLSHPFWRPLAMREAEEIKTFSTRHPSDGSACSVTGVLILPNGNILCADFKNNKVKMFSKTGSYIDHIVLRSRPFDLCWMGNDRVAVTMPYVKTISILTATETSLTVSEMDDVPLDRECSGITYNKEKFIMSTGVSSRYQICEVTRNGKVEVISEIKSPCSYLTFDPSTNDVIFGTHSCDDENDVHLFRITERKNVKSIRTRDIIKNGVLGIDVDEDGNVYACSMGTSDLLQIVPRTCKTRSILKSAKNRMTSPGALAIRETDMVISENGTDTVILYKLQ